MDILLLLVGLGLILGGANFLTDGSAAVAQRFRVPEFIIGLTIVAVGTSMPDHGLCSATLVSFAETNTHDSAVAATAASRAEINFFISFFLSP